MSPRFLTALVLGGVIAGLVDIAMASTINQMGIDIILRAIARGLLGRSAMQGGDAVGFLGLGLQVAMSVLIALIYGLASLKLPILIRRWVTFGLLYGLAVFVVMNWVVVPLSALHAAPKFKSLLFAGEHLTAMVVFAQIITRLAHKGASEPAGAVAA
jgi:hypothetical protein